jgi:hypothetical protein
MMQRLPIPLEDISLHFLGNGAVLFDHRRQRLYAANTSAAIIWCFLGEGVPPAKVVEGLVDRFGLDEPTAEQYVGDVIRQWRSWRLLDGSESATPASLPDKATDAASSVAAGTSAIPAVVRSYRLLDSIFTVRYATETLYRRADPVLRHFTVQTPAPARLVFDLIPIKRGYVLMEAGRSVERCDTLRQVTAMTKARLVYRALERCADFCAIHAGAARRGERCMLLAGESGTGKSTLLAGLMSEGFELLADDTAVLTRTLAVRPMPCSICLKTGAWDALAVRFPGLARTAIHDRPDGQTVRYLLPPEYAVVDAEVRAPVGWIVFPRYDPKIPTALHPLGKNTALRRLLPCFMPLGGRLEAAEVERLVRWIADVPCYELHHSSLNEAVVLLGYLCQ